MDFITIYIHYLKQIRYSMHTCTITFYILKQFEAFCAGQGIFHEKEVTEKIVVHYIASIKQRVSHQTHANYLIKVKSYFDYLEQEGHIFLSPLRDVELPIINRPATRILTEQEITGILNSIKTDKRRGIRLRAMLELLYSSALRPGELVNIKLNDLDFKKKTLFISKSKNLKDRVVPVGNTALFWLNRYINEVRSFFDPENTSPYLFFSTSRKAEKLKPTAVHSFTTKTLAKQGITGFYPSMLRPSCATHLLARGMNIRLIQQLLGHTDIVTTQIYLRVSIHALRKHVSPKHPADKRRENEV